jgi:hypothetical protein
MGLVPVEKKKDNTEKNRQGTYGLPRVSCSLVPVNFLSGLGVEICEPPLHDSHGLEFGSG